MLLGNTMAIQEYDWNNTITLDVHQ